MTTERFVDDRPDLDSRALRPSKILQSIAPELQPGPYRLDAAQAGDFMIYYEDGSERVFPRVSGVVLLPIAFLEKAMEWPPERGAKSAPVEAHDFVPADAEWIDVGGRKACLRPNGNRIEKTVFVRALVEGYATTFAFKSTSHPIGQRFAADADKARAQVDGETVRVCVALYKLTSEIERNQRGQSWYGPRFEKLGVLGQETGPSLEQVRQAKTLRFEFKSEEERRRKERAELSGLRPTPALSAPNPPPRGTATFTTGIRPAEAPRSWADPRPPAQPDAQTPPPPAKPGDPSDPKDDLPWA